MTLKEWVGVEQVNRRHQIRGNRYAASEMRSAVPCLNAEDYDRWLEDKLTKAGK